MWNFPYLIVGTIIGALAGATLPPAVNRAPGEVSLLPLYAAIAGLVIGLIADLCDPLKRPPGRRRKKK